MKCPRCLTENFVEHLYEKVPVDICRGCSGVWLDEGEINLIISHKEKKFNEQMIKNAVTHSFQGVPAAEKNNDLACPKCQSPMKSINYVIESGVIVDRCPKGHGLWFDKHELEKVQAYREYWQSEIAKNEQAFVRLLEDEKKQHKRSKDKDHKDESGLFTLARIFSKLF